MFKGLVFLIAMLVLTNVMAAPKKPAISAIPVRAAFLGPDTMTCYGENERCIVPVYVQSDGTATGCVVRAYFGTIIVKPPNVVNGNRIKVVWLLQLADSDENKQEYQFRDADGIIPNAGEDPANEFRNKTIDSDGEPKKRFRWTSFHPGHQGNDVHYTVNIVRVVGGQTTRCDAKDPTITNQN